MESEPQSDPTPFVMPDLPPAMVIDNSITGLLFKGKDLSGVETRVVNLDQDR